MPAAVSALCASSHSSLTTSPEDLPHVWRGESLARADSATVSTGYAALDAQLPGGGWPMGELIELLQARPELHVWQLLVPTLARLVREGVGPVVLVGAPCEPFGPGLQAAGLPAERLLCVRAKQPAARLWASEQALRCAEVVAVLAWLGQAQSAELRRLHLAAQRHGRLLFVFRPERVRQEASPARLRLLVGGVDALEVQVLKRRGPPLHGSLVLSGSAGQGLTGGLVAASSVVPLAGSAGQGLTGGKVAPSQASGVQSRIAAPAGHDKKAREKSAYTQVAYALDCPVAA